MMLSGYAGYDTILGQQITFEPTDSELSELEANWSSESACHLPGKVFILALWLSTNLIYW
jgi:hypothetical protein